MSRTLAVVIFLFGIASSCRVRMDFERAELPAKIRNEVTLSSESELVSTTKATVQVAFSEEVELSAVEMDAFSVDGGELGSLTQVDPKTFSFVTTLNSPTLTISLPEKSFKSEEGNWNKASNVLTITGDTTAPTVTLSTTESSPSFAAVFSVTAIFSERVSGFELSDLSVTNATLSNFSTSDNMTFTFDVSPNSAGVVSIDIASSVAADVVLNSNTAATTLSVSHVACPSGYILVPGNDEVGTTSDFCVMRYEAKAWNDANTNGIVDAGEVDADGCGTTCSGDTNWGIGTHQPLSQAEGQPWRRINMNEAFLECRSLNSESGAADIISDGNSDGTYALISNPEWMTIARNVEQVDSNWTGGSVRSGCLKQGNVGTGNCTSPDSGYNGPDPDSGTSRADGGTAQLTLSNGEVIWDFSGNVGEWVDWEIGPSLVTVTPSLKAYVPSDGSPVLAWREFRDLTHTSEMPLNSFMPFDSNLTSTSGIGDYFGGLSSLGGAADRGGAWAGGGVYSLLFNTATSGGHSVGFRCVYRVF